MTEEIRFEALKKKFWEKWLKMPWLAAELRHGINTFIRSWVEMPAV
jgi:hypothetical protein